MVTMGSIFCFLDYILFIDLLSYSPVASYSCHTTALHTTALAGGAPCEMRPGRDGLPEGLLENALGEAGLESRRLKEPCC